MWSFAKIEELNSKTRSWPFFTLLRNQLNFITRSFMCHLLQKIKNGRDRVLEFSSSIILFTELRSKTLIDWNKIWHNGLGAREITAATNFCANSRKLMEFTLRMKNKKFELMLTRRAKSYSSSCLQTVSISPAISSQFILGVCAAVEDRKNQDKPIILELQGLLKSSMLIRLKSSSLVLVVIGGIPMLICNRVHERLANNGKITTFTAVPLFDAFLRWFPWT